MSAIRKTMLWWLLAILLSGTVGGYFFNQAFLFVSLLLAAVLGWQLYQLHLLRSYLLEGSYSPTQGHKGLWGDIYGEIRAIRRHHARRDKRLLDSLRDWRGLVINLPEAILIMDQHSKLAWSNEAASSLLGISLSEAKGRRLSRVIRNPVWEEYLEDRDYWRQQNLQSPLDDSKMLSMQLVPLGNKGVGDSLLIARDITNMYNLDQARSDFVANVSHELRTPLTVIKGFIDAPLDEKAFSLDRPSTRKLLREQASRMQNMINDLLALSRLEMQAGKLWEKQVDVPALLQKIIADARVLSGSAAHVIKLVLDSDLSLFGDEAALYSAFSNLVFNAVNHTPARTEITVRWWVDDDGAHLCVSDTGPGIAARHIPRLSEKFYRVDEGRAQQNGTGLGMSIVVNVLTSHGAKLHVKSTEGRGSSFICDFPASRLLSHQFAKTGK